MSKAEETTQLPPRTERAPGVVTTGALPAPAAPNTATGTATGTATRAPAGAAAAGESVDAEANRALFHLAYERVEAEILAVPVERLTPINFDVRQVVTTIVGAYPEILALRARILAEFSSFDIGVVDKLKDYALALGHAHARYMLAIDAPNDLASLSEQGVIIRDQLQTDALALSKRGLVNPELVAKLHNGNGYKNVAFDLVGLVELFMDVWPKVGGKVAFTLAELERARRVGSTMVELLGQREQGPTERSKVAITRQQAYVLCADAYEEVRHAVAFVRRREGDVDDLVPKLFAGRTRRDGSKEPALAPAPAVVAPGQTTTVAPAAPTAAVPAGAVPAGHPGASPFVD